MSEQLTKRGEIYEINVALRDSQPSIWRRIQVRSDITLAKLHSVLQCVMGWENVHLHEFVIQGERYSAPGEEYVGTHRTKGERKYKLRDVVSNEGSQFAYNYDFGDYWQHVLVIEKILPPQEGARYPACLAGARACPPEDVGGIPGYENFLQAMRDPKHPEHKKLLEWIGGTFDPEAFDLDGANQKLQRMR